MSSKRNLKRQTRLILRIERALKKTKLVKAKVARDVAFHMTDWEREARTMARVWRGTDGMTDDELVSFIVGFLIHVPNHLIAAKKLAGLGPVQDIFEVGALDPE